MPSDRARRALAAIELQAVEAPDAGNVYRHEYDTVAADFVYRTTTRDLTAILEMARAELARPD